MLLLAFEYCAKIAYALMQINERRTFIMDYGMLLEDVKEVSKDALKEVSFRINEAFIQYIKELDIDYEIKKDLIIKSKDRAFFDMLLINALKD